jgi:cell division protease FtsH
VLLLVFFGPALLRTLGLGWSGQQIPYTRFRTELEAGRVEAITLRGTRIRGTLRETAATPDAGGSPGSGGQPDADGSGSTGGDGTPAGDDGDVAGGVRDGGEATSSDTHFETYVPSFGDDELLALIKQHGVELTTEPAQQDWLGPLLIGALPLLLIVGLFVAMMRRVQGQGQQIFSMGRSRARIHDDQDEEPATFDDVAGAEGAKTELREIIAFLSDPRRFQRLGGKPPKGILLVGPPGTGKTLLARATAGEAGVRFFSMTGSDFMEMFVGVGASRVRDLFKKARASAPSIIFIDELDSIGRRRGAGLGGGHDEREQTLNQLLSEMDGFETQQGVVVMAATNRPDILDTALLRPGRFDRKVTVDLPTARSRLAILGIHARGKPLADSVDLEEIARSTPGFSGADLENLLNEAALLAGRERHESIEPTDIEEARDKILMGIEREGVTLTPEEVRILSYHEAGHAVVAAASPHADPLHKVTIVPRGQAMGVTQQLPEGDRYVYSREYIQDRIVVMLGGRAAEMLVLDTATSGAENDLKQAVRLARRMVLEWGMSDGLAHLALGGERRHVFLGEDLAHVRPYSENTAQEIDEEVAKIIRNAFDAARALLEEHRDGLERVASALQEHEELMGPRVMELLGIGSAGSGRAGQPAEGDAAVSGGASGESGAGRSGSDEDSPDASDSPDSSDSAA